MKDTTAGCHSITDQLIAQDFWLTVEGTMAAATEEDSWLNIAFRYDGETGRRYELIVDKEGRYSFYLYDGEEWHTVQRWTQSTFIKQGIRETNTIQLWVRGPYVTLTINDIELITVEDDRIAEPGHILLGLEGEANAGAVAVYDNLLVLANPPARQ